MILYCGSSVGLYQPVDTVCYFHSSLIDHVAHNVWEVMLCGQIPEVHRTAAYIRLSQCDFPQVGRLLITVVQLNNSTLWCKSLIVFNCLLLHTPPCFTYRTAVSVVVLQKLARVLV